jgi:hypothetical protein
MAHPGVLQIHRIHQMVERHMRVAPTQTGEHRCNKSGEGYQRIASEGAEQEVEPHYVRLDLPDRAQNADGAGRIVEGPAAIHREA